MSLFRIDCGYQNYDWGKVGSSSAVARFAAASNPNTVIDESKPYAELWMGTHPSVPLKVVDNKDLEGKVLRDLIGQNPQKYLHQSIIDKFGSDKELPFLFKVLSIRKVLSIQAHPDKALAAQLHRSDPKNYPDDNHKPEMAIAVTDFEGFCGFKPLDQLKKALEVIPEFRELVTDKEAEYFCDGVFTELKVAKDSCEDLENRTHLQRLFSQVMNSSDDVVAEKAARLVQRAETSPETFELVNPGLADLVLRMNEQFPNDVGLFCGCMMLNHVRLSKGEAMFLQALDPHAYISGDIIECMAASDNVVRAGFTPKFKDVKNLVSMLNFTYDPVEEQKMPLLPFAKSSGDAEKSILYDPPIAEFSVLQTTFHAKAGDVQNFDGLKGPSIIIATNGSGYIKDKSSGDKIEVRAGYVFFVAPETAIVLESSSTDEGFTTYRAFVEA